MQAGCLIVLDSSGTAVETISGSPINGLWDMTALDAGSTATLFVINVLSGTVAASPNVVNRVAAIPDALARTAPTSGATVTSGSDGPGLG